MAFDYKKEYKEFYMPKGTPSIVTVPKMNYIAVRGSGNPNDADGEYKQAIGLLYGIAFTIKMSKKEDHQIDGYFDYVVPPLEGFRALRIAILILKYFRRWESRSFSCMMCCRLSDLQTLQESCFSS